MGAGRNRYHPAGSLGGVHFYMIPAASRRCSAFRRRNGIPAPAGPLLGQFFHGGAN